jgi:BirA family transcriptional regulator, biotin operon repressor / biotin---[acetyl-CoA-carboxylase] ligase
MHHIHLDQCASTQEYLKNYLQEGGPQEVLISCREQTDGKGRQGRSWIQGRDSLAFSFSLKPNPIVSLTSLEIGVLISMFFKSNFSLEIKLKWPNDLMVLGFKKCGGILCQTYEKYLLVGVGINLGEIDFSPEDLSTEIASLPIIGNQKDLPQKIYNYILKNRLSPEATKSTWENLCAHLNREVVIENERGFFVGIGESGELLLKTDLGIKKIFSGSLFLSPES